MQPRGDPRINRALALPALLVGIKVAGPLAMRWRWPPAVAALVAGGATALFFVVVTPLFGGARGAWWRTAALVLLGAAGFLVLRTLSER